MKAEIKVVMLSGDVITTSGVACPCKNPAAIEIPTCPDDE